MTTRDTRPSIIGPSEDTWRSSSSKASSRSTSSPLRLFLDSQILSLHRRRMRSTSTRWLIDFLTSIHTTYTFPILSLCIAFMRIKYYSVLYNLQHSCTSIATLIGYPPLGGIQENPPWIGCTPTRRRFRHTSSYAPQWWDFPHSEAKFDLSLMGCDLTQRIASAHS